MKRGRFITVEGIEGVGKSSNMEFIRVLLEKHGHEVVMTREPGGTALAEQIREIVLEPAAEIPPLTELLLVFAARSAHVQHKIRPAVEQGKWVLCDRFTDATLAYQGGGRGIDEQLIYQLAAAVHGELWPDLTLLLDAPVSVGLGRAAQRSALDRFEQEQTDFFERVRAAYLHVARSHPVRVRTIDASSHLAAVQEEIVAVLGPYLEQDL
ncbi:MAG: dTMP kinase [Gammaproteobacteria bacterium]|nr:dTMP kinase [Gammaproteobacteria bacterium]NNF61826.1 dTMP kinase [Gammaproteobacteria bacterium]